MKQLVLTLTLLFFIAPVTFAQDWNPQLTEYYEPEVEVVTPGVNGAPPSDAIVLFDGRDLSAWESIAQGPDEWAANLSMLEESGNDPAEWTIEGDVLSVAPGTGYIRTKQGFGDVQLHIEWRAPVDYEGPGQDKGNSGVFLQGLYEVQVLDCHQNSTYINGMTGSVYKQYPPLVSACKPTGEWHTYDIIFTAPRFKADGTLFTPATMTVIHNGVVVQNHVQLQGPTVYIGLPSYKEHAYKMPIVLQDHGNATSFRNIWVREL